MLDRIFDYDGLCFDFEAQVTACSQTDRGWEIELDRTAFYPGGGGQLCDVGTLNDFRVTEVFEKDGHIIHLISGHLKENSVVIAHLDKELRIRRMQNHSGEHLVCGIANSLFGCENTGFHMGSLGVTADLSEYLDADKIRTIEFLSNIAVFENKQINCYYPSEDELKRLDYRSKSDSFEKIRIVSIEDYDVCACCAPHLNSTGQIGIVKILDHQRYKGGTRLLMKCGLDALDEFNKKCDDLNDISVALCSKIDACPAAVQSLLDDKNTLEYKIKEIQSKAFETIKQKISSCSGNICVFTLDCTMDIMREIANSAVEKCGSIVAIFNKNEIGYNYCCASGDIDMSAFASSMNTVLNGRGGGRGQMISGSVKCTREEILSYLMPDQIVE